MRLKSQVKIQFTSWGMMHTSRVKLWLSRVELGLKSRGPPGLSRGVLLRPSSWSSGSGRGGEFHGRTLLDWRAEARTSCWGHGAHLQQSRSLEGHFFLPNHWQTGLSYSCYKLFEKHILDWVVKKMKNQAIALFLDILKSFKVYTK